MRSIRLTLYAVWLGVLCLSVGLAVYVRVVISPRMKQEAAAQKRPTPVPSTSTEELASDGRERPITVKVAVPDWDRGQLRLIIKERTTTSGLPPIHAALARLVAEVPQFPRGTTVKHVQLERGTATVDFSNEILAGMGADEEQAVLMSLRKTAGQFATVSRLRVLVEGEPVESLGGHVEIGSESLPVER